jgi:micrococcal nuclease
MPRIISFLLLLGLFSFCFGCTKKASLVNGSIVDVMDGDTLKLENGQLLRLIGVDCPEPDLTYEDKIQSAQEEIAVPLYSSHRQKSKEFVQSFLKRGNIRIETDPQHKDVDYKDRKDRLFVYVYSGKDMLNEALLREGVCLREMEMRFSYIDSFRALEEKAKENKVGLWAES